MLSTKVKSIGSLSIWSTCSFSGQYLLEPMLQVKYPNSRMWFWTTIDLEISNVHGLKTVTRSTQQKRRILGVDKNWKFVLLVAISWTSSANHYLLIWKCTPEIEVDRPWKIFSQISCWKKLTAHVETCLILELAKILLLLRIPRSMMTFL